MDEAAHPWNFQPLIEHLERMENYVYSTTNDGVELTMRLMDLIFDDTEEDLEELQDSLENFS